MKNINQKFISIVLAVAVLSCICINICGQEVIFGDVSTNHWAYESISKINGMGHMIGRGTPRGIVFDPNGTITGYEIYMTLWRVAGTPEPITEDKPFIELNSDIKSQWYTDPYEWTMYSGIANVSWRLGGSDRPEGGEATGRIGSAIKPADDLKYVMSDESFARNYATRTDVILSLYYYVTTYLNVDVSAESDMSMFSDWDITNIESESDSPLTKLNYANILAWSFTDEMIPAWQWAVANGIIKGCDDGTLQMGEYDTETRTQRYVTRAEYAVILERFIEYLDTLNS